MEAGFEGRQTKLIEKLNDGVDGCQARRCKKIESKAVRQRGVRRWSLRPSGKGDRDEMG